VVGWKALPLPKSKAVNDDYKKLMEKYQQFWSQPYIVKWECSENKPKQSTMKKLSNAVKKFLNADLQAQLKAGYRNGDLELTQDGKDVILELLADTVADKFTAAANEKIAEEEKKAA
jgi:hypothetical protein